MLYCTRTSIRSDGTSSLFVELYHLRVHEDLVKFCNRSRISVAYTPSRDYYHIFVLRRVRILICSIGRAGSLPESVSRKRELFSKILNLLHCLSPRGLAYFLAGGFGVWPWGAERKFFQPSKPIRRFLNFRDFWNLWFARALRTRDPLLHQPW